MRMQVFAAGFVAVWGSSAMLCWAGGPGNRGDRIGDSDRRQKMIDEFDLDGDGELNEQERAQARETMRERRRERGEGAGKGQRGKGGKGKIGAGRRRDEDGRGPRGGGPPMQIDPEALFDRFDADGDNQLSRAEFLQLASQIRRNREEMAGQRGPRGRRGDRDNPRFRGRPEGPAPLGQRFRGPGRPDFDRRDRAGPPRRPPRDQPLPEQPQSTAGGDEPI